MADLGGAFAQVANMEQEALRKEQERRAEEQRQYELQVQQQAEDRASHPRGDSEWESLDDAVDTRLERRGTDLKRPLTTVSERVNRDLGPELSPLMYESDTEKSRELRDDRSGRQARMEGLLAHLAGGGGSEPKYKQFYTNAPRVSGPGADAHPRPTRETMPYEGGLGGLRGAEVQRSAIRKEFGGTAPDETLTFTDRPGPGLRKWNSPGGRNEDVGAPGGGESKISFGDTGGGSKQDLIRQIIQGQIDEAKSAPRTLKEQASQVVSAVPAHNAKALELDPNDMQTYIAQEVADGKLDPRVGKSEMGRLQHLADRASNKRTGAFDRERFNEMVKRQGDPVDSTGTAVTARVQQGGTQVAQTEQKKAAALADATTTLPDAPGSTPSPALSPKPIERGRSLAGLGQRALEGVRSVLPTPPPNTGTPEEPREVSPEKMHEAQRHTLAMLARLGAPMAVMAAGPEAWIPYLAASFAGGAVGEGAGEKIEGENLDPTRMAEAGAVNTAFGAGAKLVGPAVEGIQGLRMKLPGRFQPAGVRALGDPAMLGEVGAAKGSQILKGGTQQAASQGTQSVVSASRATNLPPERFGVGPNLEAGTVQDTIFGGGQSALERTGQFSAEEASVATPRGVPKYDPASVPMRPPPEPQAWEPPLEGEYIPPPGRPLPGGPGEGALAPEDAMILELTGRGAGEGSKQLVPPRPPTIRTGYPGTPARMAPGDVGDGFVMSEAPDVIEGEVQPTIEELLASLDRSRPKQLGPPPLQLPPPRIELPGPEGYGPLPEGFGGVRQMEAAAPAGRVQLPPAETPTLTPDELIDHLNTVVRRAWKKKR